MANKKINELEQVATQTNDDLLILETENGTRSIPYGNFYKPIGEKIENRIEVHINNLIKQIPIVDNAAAHNGIFRGEHLGYFHFDDNMGNMERSFLNNIRNGIFDNIYIGDYFSISTENGPLECIIAGFDIFYNPNLSINYRDYEYNNRNMRFANEEHHVVIVVKGNDTCSINYSLKTDGISGFEFTNLYTTLYDNSDNHVEGTTEIHNTSSLLQSAFNDNILKRRTSVPSSYDSVSRTYTFNFLNTYVDLLSETQIFGTSIFNHTGYEYRNTQLPLFALDPTAKNNLLYDHQIGGYWLMNTYDKDSFVYVNNEGIMDKEDYTSSFGICPFFCIG